MAVQGLVCGDCGKTVGVINVDAQQGAPYVCKACQSRRWRKFQRVGNRKRLQMAVRRG